MVKAAEGTVHINKENSVYYVSIPARVVYDSQFKFEHQETVLVEINDGKLIISKRPSGPIAPGEPEDHPII